MIRSFSAAFALASLPVAASAAPNGLAWDSVTKIVLSADSASLQPGNFASDFAAASAVQMPDQNGGSGGIADQIKRAMSMGQGMQQMMQTGIAAHHYVAGLKERTDDLAQQTATITDCTARTITTLDLRRKTYRVVSMDQGPLPGSGQAAGVRPRDLANNGHVAISMTSTALGGREVGGEQTNGYRADATITETSASGESHTQNASMLGYYSSIERPLPSCFGAFPMAAGPSPAMMTGSYTRLMQALSAPGADPHFTVKYDGPLLPVRNLSMYDAVTFSLQSRGPATLVMERGNVHSIAPNDPIFSIPSDFTQQR